MDVNSPRWKQVVVNATKDVHSAVGDAKDAIECQQTTHGRRLITTGLLWAGAYVATTAALQLGSLDTTMRIVIAMLPVPFCAWFLWAWFQNVSAMDELARRIELEALALAFPILLVALMVLGLLEVATPLDARDWSYRNLWLMVPTLYYVGLWRAKRRYA